MGIFKKNSGSQVPEPVNRFAAFEQILMTAGSHWVRLYTIYEKHHDGLARLIEEKGVLIKRSEKGDFYAYLCEGVTAKEPSNPHDPKAVRVRIEGVWAGYFAMNWVGIMNAGFKTAKSSRLAVPAIIYAHDKGGGGYSLRVFCFATQELAAAEYGRAVGFGQFDMYRCMDEPEEAIKQEQLRQTRERNAKAAAKRGRNQKILYFAKLAWTYALKVAKKAIELTKAAIAWLKTKLHKEP